MFSALCVSLDRGYAKEPSVTAFQDLCGSCIAGKALKKEETANENQ